MKIIKWVLLVSIVTAAVALVLYRGIGFRVDWPELSGELKAYKLEHDEEVRRYQVYVPVNLPARPAVVVVFHGSMSDSDSIRYQTAAQFDVAADRHGYLLVYPDGFDKHWNDCRGGASYKANTENIDDIGFFRSMLAELQTAYQIDPDRVYITGLSNGGHMALKIALEAPELIKAAAPIAASLPAEGYLDCEKSGVPVSLAVVNGLDDPINPYEGGLVKILWDDSRGVVSSSAQTMNYFVNLLEAETGESIPPEESMLPDLAPGDNSQITLREWRTEKRVLRLYSVVGGGHTVPSLHADFSRMLGGTNHDIDIAEELWNFFSTLP